MNGVDGKLRFIVFQILVLVAFSAVAVKLWDLQIVSADKYRASADENQYRLRPIRAARGVMYDRTGRLLLRNVPSFTVSIVPAGLPEDPDERAAVLRRVGELLGMPALDEDITAQPPQGEDPGADDAVMATPRDRSIETLLRERTVNVNTPVRIATNVERSPAFVLEEEHLNLPGVRVDVEPLREYFYGELLGHIVGYLGRIPAELEKEYLEDPTFTYERSDLVGLSGLEASQEALLRGQKGQKHVQVDAFEREMRVVAQEEPTPGSSIMLTIDVNLQQVLEDALRKGMAAAGSEVGVAIVMDPRTGEILATASLPGFDNNLFSGGISYEDFARLNNDPRRPLVNHAISGQYPPGSSFKIVPASAALEEGVITTHTTVRCPGVMYLPNRFAPNDRSLAQPFYCWNRGGHGVVNVHTALVQSCNIFFNQVAGGYEDLAGLGIDRLGAAAKMFGFGARLGVDLPGEATGLIPDDRWKRTHYHESWMTGDTYNAGIGQGYILATPLQVLNAMAAIANGGTLYRPQLVYQVIAPDGTVIDALQPDPIRQLDISPENIQIVRDGVHDAVRVGTAYRLRMPGLDAAGKTGTAEFVRLDEDGNLMVDRYGNLPTHAWFTAFAPFDDPEIAMVVFLDNGGEGSRTAVPVAAEVMRHYFGLGDGAQ